MGPVCPALILIPALLLLLCPPARAQQVITWPRIDFPPFEITQGPLAGRGLLDGVEAMVRDALPQYTHCDGHKVNFKRLFRLIADGRPVCYSCVISAPFSREIGHLSLPAVATPGFMLITTANRPQPAGPVSLARFLAETPHTLGLTSRRYYGLDHILDKYWNTPRLLVRPGSGSFAGLMKMLFINRLNYLLGYPMEALYQARLMGKEEQIRLIPLTEVGGRPVVGRIVCTRDEWGRAVIRDINRVLLQIRGSDEFRQLNRHWVAPELLPDFLDRWAEIKARDTWTSVD